MDLKNLLQQMKDIETTEALKENPMPSGMPPMGAPQMDQGSPVSMNVSLNASGKDHVEDLIDMMKNAGLGSAKEVDQDMMPVRQDMDRLQKMFSKGDEKDGKLDLDIDGDNQPDIDTEGYDNEPEDEYQDTEYMTKDLAGGLNREKDKHALRAKDPAIHVEDIKSILQSALAEKMKSKKSKKPNDGNLANNAKPYDKVTRADVIAGATGNDEMGGKKKKSEDIAVEGRGKKNKKKMEDIKTVEGRGRGRGRGKGKK